MDEWISACGCVCEWGGGETDNWIYGCMDEWMYG